MQTIIDQLLATSWIEWLGTITGVVGVYLSIKEKVVAWLLFIVCYSAYVYLSWQAELYAALKMNVVFIVISIYGWISWSKALKAADAPREVGHTPRSQLLIAAAFIVCGSFGFGWGLSTYTSGFMPYLDAFAMSCAFTAQWMLSRKYIENWLCWIIADVIYVGLWGIQGYLVSAGLFIGFSILAIKGWFEWKPIAQASRTTEKAHADL